MRPADEDDESEDDDDDDEDDDDDDEDASETSSKDKPAARQMSSLQPQRPAATMPPKAPGDDDFKMGWGAVDHSNLLGLMSLSGMMRAASGFG